MEGELKSLIQVWSLAFASLSYCYYLSSRVPKGFLRLLSILPVLYLFLLLPFRFSSAHFTGITSFFLAWLATFRLLLFSFGQPPLSPTPPNVLHFIFLAFLPIKVKQNPPPSPPPYRDNVKLENHIDPKNHVRPTSCSSLMGPEIRKNSNGKGESLGRLPQMAKQVLILTLKVTLLAIVFQVYEYRQNLPKNVILLLYCLHLYLELELVLALCAAPARALLNLEIEPQFDEPYLATSLQDFWGRRWNLTVTGVLRPTVYKPTRRISTPVVGPRWAQPLAVFASFLLSGLMHELIYYHIIRVPPTWEVTCFFILHGMCVVIEVAMKKVAAEKGSWRLPPAVSVLLTLAFVAVTGLWLFFPQIVRNGIDEGVIEEHFMFMDFVKSSVATPLVVRRY